MKPVVAIVAAGNMGAGVARRLVDHGISVLTTLAGRSEATRARAGAAGMIDVPPESLMDAEVLLCILPPASASSFAQQMVPMLTAARKKPLFVDCNAVNPSTVRQIHAVIAPTGASFVDGGIIGNPPEPGKELGPHIYVSGEHAEALLTLVQYGLDIRVLSGPVGAASALKMAYAGINKGHIAVVAAMILAAERSGSAAALREELAESDLLLLSAMAQKIPRMFSKAHRWVSEMEEIAEFAREDPAAHEIFMGFSKLYARLAEDLSGEKREINELDQFFRPS